MIAGRFSFAMDSYDIPITHWYTFTLLVNSLFDSREKNVDKSGWNVDIPHAPVDLPHVSAYGLVTNLYPR